MTIQQEKIQEQKLAEEVTQENSNTSLSDRGKRAQEEQRNYKPRYSIQDPREEREFQEASSISYNSKYNRTLWSGNQGSDWFASWCSHSLWTQTPDNGCLKQ